MRMSSARGGVGRDKGVQGVAVFTSGERALRGDRRIVAGDLWGLERRRCLTSIVMRGRSLGRAPHQNGTPVCCAPQWGGDGSSERGMQAPRAGLVSLPFPQPLPTHSTRRRMISAGRRTSTDQPSAASPPSVAEREKSERRRGLADEELSSHHVPSSLRRQYLAHRGGGRGDSCVCWGGAVQVAQAIPGRGPEVGVSCGYGRREASNLRRQCQGEG